MPGNMKSDVRPHPGVTFTVSRKIIPGHEGAFERWGKKIIDLSAHARGNLGVTILTPDTGTPGLIYIIHRFEDEDCLFLWQSSPEVRKLVAEADTFSTRHYEKATGLETWFHVPELDSVPPPARWKMFLVVFAAAALISFVLRTLLSPYLSDWPLVVTTIIYTSILVALLTWVAMPYLSQLLESWLYPVKSRRINR
jgi:hypothetical protein